ncbi:MAG: hypothetical protein Q9210_007299, partial [Variospora velana]
PGGANPPPNYSYTSISLVPYLRRLVVTGLDFPGVLHGFFGDDWASGVGPLHEQERRNYLFAAKSGGWASVKKDYDMGPAETVPFMRPLQGAVGQEIEAAEKTWSEWLAMEDWMVGPRAPEGMQGQQGGQSQQQQQQQRQGGSFTPVHHLFSPLIPKPKQSFFKVNTVGSRARPFTTLMSKRHQPEHPELIRPSTKRAKEVDHRLPYDKVQELLKEQGTKDQVSTVAHWFRSKDLRIYDNIGLHHASTLAEKEGKPLVALYIWCDEEFEWHGTSPARCDFVLENLALMQKELAGLNIPLVVVQADGRADIVPAAVKFMKDNGVSHVFGNYEYEVDELRRDIKFLRQIKEQSITSFHHDQTVIEPGTMKTGSGGPMKVFSPYHRAWLAEVKASPDLLDTVPPPTKVDTSRSKTLSSLFGGKLPQAPVNKRFASDQERNRIRGLWPAGHSAGIQRRDKFINECIEDYAATRSNPAKNTTSRMSAYFSAGVVSVREALSQVKDYNNGSSDFGSSGSTAGVSAWVREIVFRELYRQTTLTTPHTVMNLPQNLKFEFVKWEEDEEGWYKWKEGRTGMPFVDAGMRQINYEAYMHNRLRMNVSSYLYCNLLIDYRRGERYFAETLIDWDLSNNTQGWEPSYTVFNPVSQAEKNDPDGNYIREWVPELKNVKGKAVFDPYNRLPKAEFEKLGYPAHHVDWRETKERAIQRFKSDMAQADP